MDLVGLIPKRKQRKKESLSSLKYKLTLSASLYRSCGRVTLASGTKHTSKLPGTTSVVDVGMMAGSVGNSFGKETRQSFIKSNGQHLPRVSSATGSDDGRVTRYIAMSAAAAVQRCFYFVKLYWDAKDAK